MPSSDQFMSFTDQMDPTRKWRYGRFVGDWLHAKILHHGAVLLRSNWVNTYMSDPQWRLYYNLDPGSAIYVNEQRYELCPDQIYVLPAWLTWRGSVEQPFRHMFFGVDIPQFSQVQTRQYWPHPMCLEDCDSIKADWYAICQDWIHGKEQHISEFAHWYSIMYRILGQLFLQVPPPESGTPEELQELCIYIEAHLDTDLSNEHLAEIAHCSSGHLIRRFGKLMGQSPANYVRERRLSAAAHRLAYTAESIDSIAYEFGFPNRHYFSRVFHKMMGYPPAAYRKLFRIRS